jgi:hypothetical protein
MKDVSRLSNRELDELAVRSDASQGQRALDAIEGERNAPLWRNGRSGDSDKLAELKPPAADAPHVDQWPVMNEAAYHGLGYAHHLAAH